MRGQTHGSGYLAEGRVLKMLAKKTTSFDRGSHLKHAAIISKRIWIGGDMKSLVGKLAKQHGTSIYAVAKAARVTPECIYYWEKRGIQGAKLEQLDAVALALDCSIEDLYER